MEHGAIRNRTGNGKNLDDFSDEVREFVVVLLRLQTAHNEADYNPRRLFDAMDVAEDISDDERAIELFQQISDREKWSFAIHILINARRL